MATTVYFDNELDELIRVVAPQWTWRYEYDALSNRIAITPNGSWAE